MKKDLLFWNVDTQIDFIEPNGKLYAPGAEKIKPVLQWLTDFAAAHAIQVVNTADFHYSGSAELSNDPDFVNTFPEHCMANTKGAEYVPETDPENPLVFDWSKEYLTLNEVKTARNIVIRKDAFDVFTGSPHSDGIVKLLAPKTVVVYGVTTNVCVNDAVIGLAERVDNVLVVEDAIKELPNIPLPFENWKRLGVKMISSLKLDKFI